jgi:hypothetical protein
MATTYATITELKSYVGIKVADTGSDTLLQRVLDAAARMFDGATRGGGIEGAEAYSASASATRYYDDDNSGVLYVDDVLTVTALTRGGTAIDTADYKLYPYNPGSGPYTRIYLRADAETPITLGGTWYGYPQSGVGLGQFAVTGTWGYCTAANRPEAVKHAVLSLAAVMYKAGNLSMEQVLNMVSDQDPVGIMARNVKDAVGQFRRERNWSIA